MNDFIELVPPTDLPREWEAIETLLREYFKEEIYRPLLKLLREPERTLKNAKPNPLYEALRSGRVTYSRGVFSGRLNADISKALKSLGAKFDRSKGTFRLPLKELPREARETISATETRFQEKLSSLDKKLSEISPGTIASGLRLTGKFDTVLWKADKDFRKRVEGIMIPPTLTPHARKRIAEDWQNNMELYIKDFTQEQIKSLRREVKQTVFAGDRFGSLLSTIQKSYGVSANKAKFLARQETKFLVSKFQETRYEDAGIREYTWHHVAGSPGHPVRPKHKKLGDATENGRKKVYRFDDPPNTAEDGEAPRYNNPGQDYNCRCSARPVVRFKR